MTLQDDMERIAGTVERRLGELLAAPKGVEEGGGEGEETGALADAVRYAALGGGKRIRPFLLIKAAGLFDVSEPAALDAACALECVHCYSLVHDDLPAMDDDAVRRGRPTVHMAFDEATAILTGDCLLTLAFEIMSAPQTHDDPAVRTDLVRLLAQASGWKGMALGQALDLSAERRSFSQNETRAMQRLKTGALFRFACEAGAVLGRAGSTERAALASYADALGQAFQLADDLLDARGDAEAMGKAASKDAARGKATLVSLLGEEHAASELGKLVSQGELALAPFGERGTTLIEMARFVAARRA